METKDLAGLIGSLGFPIVVTWFLLTKGTLIVANITTAINEMRLAIVEMSATVKSLGDRLENIEKERNKKEV